MLLILWNECKGFPISFCHVVTSTIKTVSLNSFSISVHLSSSDGLSWKILLLSLLKMTKILLFFVPLSVSTMRFVFQPHDVHSLSYLYFQWMTTLQNNIMEINWAAPRTKTIPIVLHNVANECNRKCCEPCRRVLHLLDG